ncbi:OPA3-like protein [Impatiens glandulifera]|uniref:OPA3-like protein n=1 Tax=Impatiens glandulifera TaxID=253017 RepID=UPI001FB16227|nr:OPA3-like protein [Impatiens glandulifera]
MVLPFLKLGTLVLKTLSKPIAARLKKEAGLHPRFRSFIINIAQANHRMTTTIQRYTYAHATNVEIRPLNEEKAVSDAVDLIGELFLFTVAGAVVVFEVQRSSRSEARKEELRRSEMEGMRQRDEELGREVELMKSKIGELEQLAKSKGLLGVLNFRQHPLEDSSKLEKA